MIGKKNREVTKITMHSIAQDLPHIPKEVIEIWLAPLAKRAGWPPTRENDWRYILGSSRDLNSLKRLQWEKQVLPLSPQKITARDMNIIIGLFKSHVLEQTTIYSASMSDGKDRFLRCCEYLKEHGVFPKPVVLETTASGQFHVLDGFHRLCAFFYLYGYFNIQNKETPCLKVLEQQPVWVGFPPGM